MSQSAIKAGYREANCLRKQLGLAVTQPADPCWAAKQIGLLVVLRPFEARRVAGLHVYRKDGDIAIAVINNSDTKARQRFTLAHEIAHNIFDREETILDDLSTGGLREVRANCFAGEFLLPQAAIANWRPKRPWTESPQDIAELALHYGVSYEAALYRLKSADRLSKVDVANLKDRYYEIDDDARARISQRNEEIVVLPQEFLDVAEAAYEKRAISRGKYEELKRGIVEK